MSGVFDGIRVLDVSHGVAGPMTSKHLADLGAQVTRIERPGRPSTVQSSGARVWNRDKHMLHLDLATATGRAELARLAATADVVVDSFAPGTALQLGLDHDALAQHNSRLITCSITGYGTTGPDRDRPGYDALVAARTGLLFDQRGRRGTAMEFINGRDGPHSEFDAPKDLRRGAPRPGPVFPRTPWPSIGAMYLATLGITAALRARELTGAGQRVATSLLQGALAAECLHWQRVDNPDAPLYWMWPSDSRAIDGLYECADGHWVHHWTVRPSWVLESAREGAIGTVELPTSYRADPDRLSMDADGLLAGIFLHPLLAEAFATHPASAWVDAAASAGVGITPVRSPAEALADDAFLADGCVVAVDDPEVGRIRHVGPAIQFVREPHVGAPAPPTNASRPLPHPLAGIRVLDLGIGIAGPFGGRMLADLGADVIKIDAPHDTYWTGTHAGLSSNRGKRSVAIDLTTARGRAVLDRLLERADVVTTNWRPGVAARFGVDAAALRARFPSLVYCDIRGYDDGPRRALPGTDQTTAALCGVEWANGACDSGNPPLWSRSSMGDTGTGLLAAIAITSALYHRDRTGEGSTVSTALVNAQLLHTSHTWIDAGGRAGGGPSIDANQYGFGPYYRMYACSDGRWVFVAAVTQAQQHALFHLVATPTTPADDGATLAAHTEAFFAARCADECLRTLGDAEVPAESVDEYFCRQLFHDDDARARELIATTHAHGVGRFEDPGVLVELSNTPCVVQRGPSRCGEHTREILREHGYGGAEIDDLVATGAVLALADSVD